MRFDLLNVTVRLVNPAPLACVNFIKSRLTIESFSNYTHDIDLVSQEILIKDTRFEGTTPDKKFNVFVNILQPIKKSNSNIIQVQVHSRKRQNKSESTILLNNMRLMMVFDWWMAARNFVFQDIDDNISMHNPNLSQTERTSDGIEENYEVKLNITDSEIVVVEDTSQWDTNAVILKVPSD